MVTEVISFHPSPSSEVKGILATKTSRAAALVFQGYLFIYLFNLFILRHQEGQGLKEVVGSDELILPKHLKNQGSLSISYELISSFTPIVYPYSNLFISSLPLPSKLICILDHKTETVGSNSVTGDTKIEFLLPV